MREGVLEFNKFSSKASDTYLPERTGVFVFIFIYVGARTRW